MNKTLVLYDLEHLNFNEFNSDDYSFIDANSKSANCKGCFNCWLKVPGKCVMSDRLQHIGTFMMKADEIIIISRIVYGGFSTEIKKLLDRSIPGVLPFFKKREGRTHHFPRYKNKPNWRVFFYDIESISQQEKELAKKIVTANAINFYANTCSISFIEKDNLYTEIQS